MTGNRDAFVKLDEEQKSQVKFGDGKLTNVEGKGSIVVKAQGGNSKLVHDVLYVPGLAQNLLSVGQLIQKGYLVKFDEDNCVIIDKKNNQKIVQIKMAPNKVFPFSMPLKNCALKTEVLDGYELWHLRYGHLNYQGLKLLKQKNMVIGLPSFHMEEKICEGCIYGKMHRLPFPKTSWRAKAPLELIHADICGPTKTPSLNERMYFLLFVDDFTRMMWVYILQNKSEAFSCFIKFKVFVEKQSGLSLKILRTDRGKEFTSNEFMNFCNQNGIKKQLIVRRTPQ